MCLQCLTGPDTLPVFQSLASPPQSDNLTVAIEALHVKQARIKSKKQRHCSFCKIHGFPINIKGDSCLLQFHPNVKRMICWALTAKLSVMLSLV